MIIRTEQIEQMQKSRADDYVEAFARYLESHFGVQTAARQLAGARLRDVIHEAIQDAHGYEVRDPEDVKLYVECVALLSPKFDVNPETAWAGTILRRSDLMGTAKMDAVNEVLLFGPGGPL